MSNLIRSLFYYPSARKLFKHTSTGFLVIIAIFLFIILCIGFFKFYLQYHTQLHHLNELKEQFEIVKKNSSLIKKFEQASIEHNKQYEKFIEHKIDIPHTVEDIKNMMSNLQNRLKIQFLNSYFSPSNHNIQNNLKMSSYDIQIDIKVLQDQQFFSFLNKIQNEWPGIITIKNFYLKRLGPLTKELLHKVRDKKSVLFDGRILLNWTFLDKTKVNM